MKEMNTTLLERTIALTDSESAQTDKERELLVSSSEDDIKLYWEVELSARQEETEASLNEAV